jgi:hypothetical protein
VSAEGAERSKITADETQVVIERHGFFAQLRSGASTTTFMRDITGVHVASPRMGFRGWIQILVGGEPPTTWTGANQHPRCMYFNASQLAAIQQLAEYIDTRITPVRRIEEVGLDSVGVPIGAAPAGDGTPAAGRPIILAITSNPQTGGPALGLDNEINRIRDALEGSPRGRDFNLQDRPAARVDELVGDLLEYPPRILHFSGHGIVSGLVFTGPDGLRPFLGNPVALAHLIQQPRVKPNLRVIVLNVCLSAEQAEFLAKFVPVVIGTRDTVPDDVAIAFSHGFYSGVGNSGTAEEAFSAGVASASLVSPAAGQLYALASAGNPAAVSTL